MNGKEHFGFADGISQPIIDGLSKSGIEENTVRAGEFILGYPNEYGQFTVSPLVKSEADSNGILPTDINGSGDHDFGRNGSYLVFRQLHQKVHEFWQFLDQETRNSDNSSNPEARTKLAAKMVGRWPSGAPLALAAEHDQPELHDQNDFLYHKTDPLRFEMPVWLSYPPVESAWFIASKSGFKNRYCYCKTTSVASSWPKLRQAR